MPWIQQTVDGGEAGLIPTGWLNTDTGEFTTSNPYQNQQLPAGLQSAINYVDGGEAGLIGQQSYTLNGQPLTTTYSGTGANGRQAGVTNGEQSYWATINGQPVIVPKSVALQLDPNAIPYEQTADGGFGGGFGGLGERYLVPGLTAAVLGAGATGFGGAGAAEFGSAGVPDALSSFGGGSFGGEGLISGSGYPSWMTGGSGTYNPLNSVGGSYVDTPLLNGSTMLNSSGGASPINWLSEAGINTGSGASSMFNTLAEKVGPTAAKSLFEKLTSGDVSSSDWMKLAGTLGSTALGVLGANQQSDALTNLANKYSEFGAPSRARYEASFAPGFSMESDPGYKDALDQTTKSFLNKASIAGNPAESPNAWTQTLKDVNSSFAYPALQNYRSQNASAGGLQAATSAAPQIALNATNAKGGVYDAIGSGMADIFNPKQDFGDFLRKYGFGTGRVTV